MPQENEVKDSEREVKTHVQIVCEGGVALKMDSFLTEEELIKSIELDGGASRTGYALIPCMVKANVESEHVRVFRQRIVSYLITTLAANRASGLVLPSDKQVMEMGVKH